MKKEIVDKANEYLCKYGKISTPFLQQKLKLTHKAAKELFKKVNSMKTQNIHN